mmetsp:Transcript_24996/g.75082  ORF Transcript_24996/g.75082 Transcript_24996/m.75082 type:complete len:1073 (+) Transcript_24996:389-3607(+)
MRQRSALGQLRQLLLRGEPGEGGGVGRRVRNLVRRVGHALLGGAARRGLALRFGLDAPRLRLGHRLLGRLDGLLRGLRAGLLGGCALGELGNQLKDVGVHLVGQGRHSAVHLWPIQRQRVIHLAAQHLHQLRAAHRVQALELQVVLRGHRWRVKGLPHGHEHLHGKVHVSMVRWQLVQDQDRQALLGRGHEPVVVVPNRPDVLPEGAEAVAGVRGQARVLADRDLVPLEAAHDSAQRARLVTHRGACPLHRGAELLRGEVRQQVARDRQQHVRGKVDVLAAALVVDACAARNAQRPLPDLFTRQLSSHWHQADGALHGGFDLHENLLDVLGQVAESWVDEVAHGRGSSDDRHKHRADPLLGLALFPLDVHALLGVAVSPEVALDEQGGCFLQLLPDQLQLPLPHASQALVQNDLHIDLGLEAPPIGLDPLRGQLHAAHFDPVQHASGMCLDVRRLPALPALQLAPLKAAGHRLDLGGVLVLLAHGLAPVEVASVLPLDAHHGVVQRRVPAAGEQPPEVRLELPHIGQHLVEVPARLEAGEDRLHPRHAVLEFDVVLLRPVLPVPLLQDFPVRAVLPLDLFDVPHALRPLYLPDRVVLLLDAPPDDRAFDVPLQDRQRALFVGLGEDFGSVIGDHIVLEVVIIPLHTRRKPRRLKALQQPMLLGCLLKSRLEGVGVEKEPRVALPGAVLVRLVVSREETPAVREANVQQRQVIPQAGRLRRRQVARARDRHGPVPLSADRPVRLEEARRAEVVGALLAPHDRIQNAALRALELGHRRLAEVPQKFVLDALVEVLAETLDHRVDGLQRVGWEVQVEARVVADDYFPLGRQRVAHCKHAIPIMSWLASDAELRRHVLHHLGRDGGLLHVVGVPPAPQVDPHCAQAFDAERRGARVQHVRGQLPARHLPCLPVDLDENLVGFVQARREHRRLVDFDWARLGAGSVLLVPPRGLQSERVHPVGDLTKRKCLKGFGRKGAQAQRVQKVDVRNLLFRLDRPLRVPAMERINGLAWVGTHHVQRVREAPRVRMVHHDIDEIHAGVIHAVLSPLKLEPQHAIGVPGVHLLEVLPRDVIGDV